MLTLADLETLEPSFRTTQIKLLLVKSGGLYHSGAVSSHLPLKPSKVVRFNTAKNSMCPVCEKEGVFLFQERNGCFTPISLNSIKASVASSMEVLTQALEASDTLSAHKGVMSLLSRRSFGDFIDASPDVTFTDTKIVPPSRDVKSIMVDLGWEPAFEMKIFETISALLLLNTQFEDSTLVDHYLNAPTWADAEPLPPEAFIPPEELKADPRPWLTLTKGMLPVQSEAVISLMLTYDVSHVLGNSSRLYNRGVALLPAPIASALLRAGDAYTCPLTTPFTPALLETVLTLFDPDGNGAYTTLSSSIDAAALML